MRSHRIVRVCRRMAALLVLGILAAPVDAQDVEVIVTSAETSAALAGAMVELRVPAGVVSAALTDERGRVRFATVPAGTYAIVTEIIGYARAQDRVEHGSETTRLELRLASQPISLEGIAVTSERRCSAVSSGDTSLSAVWDHVRRALDNASLTQEERRFRYSTLNYERDLDRALRQTTRLREERRERDRVSPYVTRDPAKLTSDGFFERSMSTETYFAPDAALLVSEGFLEGHCMWVRRGGLTPETQNLVGLAFEPVRATSSRVDIAGTLWIDPTESSLEWLEYRYTNLEGPRADSRVGGRIDFERLEDGRWIVSAWWVRTPSLSIQRGLDDEVLSFLSGFRESGGVVLEAEGAGSSLSTTALGTLQGRVTIDGSDGPATILMGGSARGQVVDPDGRFAFTDLVPGLYQLLIDHPMLGAYALPPALRGVRVEAGESTTTVLALDPAERLRVVCQNEIPTRPAAAPPGAWPPGESSVIVHVVDERGRPVPDSDVSVGWAAYAVGLAIARGPGRTTGIRGAPTDDVPVVATINADGLTHLGRADQLGRVRFCGLPENQAVTVRVSRTDRAEVQESTRTPELPGPVVVRVVLPEQPRRSPGPLRRNGTRR